MHPTIPLANQLPYDQLVTTLALQTRSLCTGIHLHIAPNATYFPFFLFIPLATTPPISDATISITTLNTFHLDITIRMVSINTNGIIANNSAAALPLSLSHQALLRA